MLEALVLMMRGFCKPHFCGRRASADDVWLC